MAQIELKLEKQLLTIQNREILASGGVLVDKCLFHFDESWDGYTCTGVFYQDKNSVQYAVLNKDNTCDIPPAARAKEGRMYIGVFGVKGSSILTSTLDTIDILEGAISGDNVSTEPTDDVFLAIIAQYQRIIDMMAEYEQTAEEFNATMKQQNEILETLNAFDVVEIQKRLNEIEDCMINYTNIALTIQNREVVLRDISIKFIDRVCRIEHEAFTENSLCDVYFDEMSYEQASKALILPVSHDGYVEISSSEDISEELTASMLIRRY